MYKHILLPVELDTDVDLSDACAKAQALLSEDGRMTLLHVVQPIPAYVETQLPPELPAQTIQTAKSELAALADKHGASGSTVLIGPIGRSIVDWADENAAECIVMASHQPAISDLLLGSTAAWVVRHAHCAVLVLR